MSLQASLSARVGGFRLDVALEAASGELVVVVGPNGAGKTTLLRALAGLVPLEGGTVVLDGEVLDGVPAERRPVGMVFQDYRLFPHLSVLENVAFGLRARGTPRAEARRCASSWLERMELDALAPRKPGTLSGGQAQRVALARALATDPRLLLLDEPLAALDAAVRPQVRRELRRHLESFDGTRLLVTHDPLEAITLADRVVVMEAGQVVQAGTVPEITARPRSAYVARLVGLNLFRGHARGDHIELQGGASLVVAGAGTGPVFAVVHPRAVTLHRELPQGTPRNVWRGELGGLDHEGDRVRVEVTGDIPVIAEVTPAATHELRLDEGGPIWVSVKATEIDVYPA